jgi:hypothetical protein
MWRVAILLLILFRISTYSAGQHTPLITNYNALDYKAHHQNWSITQWHGKMYIANTHGLLQFNANNWNLSKLKSNKIIRSVYTFKDRIYTGSYGEIGYWTLNDCLEAEYHDLKSLIPPNTIENEEIWHITSSGNTIYFQSFSILLAYDGTQFKKVEMPGSIMFLQVLDGKKYIQGIGSGIYTIDNQNKTSLLPNSTFFKDKTITGILSFDSQTLLITTSSHGVYKYNRGQIEVWNKQYTQYFAEVQINKSLKTENNTILLGTIRDGLLVFDLNGGLRYHINTANGLVNNTVLALYQDSDKHIWLGLDKGIAMIDIAENMLRYKDVNGSIGSTYAAVQLDSVMYLGTNQGVYYYDMSLTKNPSMAHTFTLVKGTQGQVWDLFLLDDKVLCGHNEGSFLIKNKKGVKISNFTGGWYHEIVVIHGKKYILQGNYTGLCIFTYENGNVAFDHKITGYNLPVKKFYVKGNTLWVHGPNNGIKRLLADSSFSSVSIAKSYEARDGLPNPENIDFNVFHDQMYVWDGASHYLYDAARDIFVPDNTLNLDGEEFMFRAGHAETWFKIFPDHAVKMKKTTTQTYIPYSLNKDYHNITVLSNGGYLYCLDDGYLIQKELSDNQDVDKVVKPLHLSVSYGNSPCQYVYNAQPIEIPYPKNEIKIAFWDAYYHTGKKYEYRLLPALKNWKPVNSISEISFTNLNYGSYDIQIKRNDGTIASATFKVMHPWYLSLAARLFYIILLACILYLFIKYFEKKLALEKERHRRESERLIREHEIQMENQRLAQENVYKNMELANASMHLIEKNTLLEGIKGELMEIRRTKGNLLSGKELQNILKRINENKTFDDDRQLFETSFEEIHGDFFKKLKAIKPNLTHDDLKLAAFIKMNLPSKDLAPIFNISVRGLENRRYRLRKKLNLDHDINLSHYFENL